MGTVFCATDTTLDRVVAVKLLAERYVADDSARRRFAREARAAARVSSDPNIVTIFDVGDAGGRPYIVMEYIAGSSLEERLRSGRQKPADAMRWLEQAGRALDYAHLSGVVHRDVKPGNLLLDRADNVHVADFGIASAAWMPSLTVSGTILGTAGYLAPEQALGEPTSPASDRYALAVVAYELLTGSRPFARESPTAEAQAHVAEPVPSASARGNLPPEVDRGVPARARQAAGTALRDVRRLRVGAAHRTRRCADGDPCAYGGDGAAPAARAAASHGAPRSSSRKPLLAVLIGAALLALVLAGVLLARPSSPKQTASPPAKPRRTRSRRSTSSTRRPRPRRRPRRRRLRRPRRRRPRPRRPHRRRPRRPFNRRRRSAHPQRPGVGAHATGPLRGGAAAARSGPCPRWREPGPQIPPRATRTTTSATRSCNSATARRARRISSARRPSSPTGRKCTRRSTRRSTAPTGSAGKAKKPH